MTCKYLKEWPATRYEPGEAECVSNNPKADEDRCGENCPAYAEVGDCNPFDTREEARGER